MVVLFYISGHGFGHATRSIEVMSALASHRPDARVVVRSSVPAWLFASARIAQPALVQPLHTDTGVWQADSLRLDTQRTALEAARFYGGFEQRTAAEAEMIRHMAPAVVVADVPPLAFAAAARAGVPAMALANFTWDWIYEGFQDFEQRAPGVLDIIRDAYARATRALRLPLHGGFEPMAAVTTDIALIARRSTRPRASTRAALGLPDAEPVVLASFGGHGLDLAYARTADVNRFTLVVTDHEATSAADAKPAGRLRRFSRSALAAKGIRYEDLVAAADVVVTKPGYGIVSECIANGVAIVYASRGSFVEEDVLVAEMPRFVRCERIDLEDLKAGRWRAAVDTVLARPAPQETMRVDGAGAAARVILDLV